LLRVKGKRGNCPNFNVKEGDHGCERTLNIAVWIDLVSVLTSGRANGNEKARGKKHETGQSSTIEKNWGGGMGMVGHREFQRKHLQTKTW